jgi:hypothetical protein
MVRDLLVIQVPDASDQGMVTILRRPIDCFFLGFESAEHLVRMGFDYIILNVRSFMAALGTSFYVNVHHSSFLSSILSDDTGSANVSSFEFSAAESPDFEIPGAIFVRSTLLRAGLWRRERVYSCA